MSTTSTAGQTTATPNVSAATRFQALDRKGVVALLATQPDLLVDGQLLGKDAKGNAIRFVRGNGGTLGINLDGTIQMKTFKTPGEFAKFLVDNKTTLDPKVARSLQLKAPIKAHAPIDPASALTSSVPAAETASTAASQRDEATLFANDGAAAVGATGVGAAAGPDTNWIGKFKTGFTTSSENQLGRVVGTASSVDMKAILKDTKISVISGVPMQMIFDSTEYTSGKLKANQYLGKVASESLGYASWTLAGAAMGSVVPGGTLIGGILGMGAGMVANEVWTRTIGKKLTPILSNLIPNGVAKPIADVFTKVVANPLHKVWHFVWKHKAIAGVGLGLLALRFPGGAGIAARMGVQMAGGTALGMGFNKLVLDKIIKPKPDAGAAGSQGAAAGGSAFGDLSNQIQLDDKTRLLLHKRYASTFPWDDASVPPQEKADAEMLCYVKALAETQSDPQKIQQLEQLQQQMLQQFQGVYGGGGQGAPSQNAASASSSAPSSTSAGPSQTTYADQQAASQNQALSANASTSAPTAPPTDPYQSAAANASAAPQDASQATAPAQAPATNYAPATTADPSSTQTPPVLAQSQGGGVPVPPGY